ncbi:nitrilase-related carbon-nitrogen hydrolase [Bacillus sp. B15-48]|uniref:nitrilase-related carbon-nitrogen hydrolase n=1 Tax=Bacillus sp. B15-48 TaxID=1548601 RepID=UPI00193F6DB0|nr:nitrilase-related carbon-nitrogen hydrolase [Bacillus sp. B15-48]MBM4764871.1 hydratase [Bacillus sp. B15-48]
MTTIKTAVLQFESKPGNVKDNISRSILYMEKAAKQGAKLVVLPELCQSGYDLTPEMAQQVAESIDGESVEKWTQFASLRDIYIVGGLCEKANGLIYNSAVLIGPDGYIGTYRKAHLFYNEKKIFTQGDTGFPVFDLGWGKVSMLICYDLRFPEAVRMAAMNGAEIICAPTAWVTPVGKQWDDRGFSMQAYCAMAHASMNRIYIACADACGGNQLTQFLGGSLIAGPSGWPVTGPASVEKHEFLTADLDLLQTRTKAHNPQNNLFADRRTDIYGEFTLV